MRVSNGQMPCPFCCRAMERSRPETDRYISKPPYFLLRRRYTCRKCKREFGSTERLDSKSLLRAVRREAGSQVEDAGVVLPPDAAGPGDPPDGPRIGFEPPDNVRQLAADASPPGAPRRQLARPAGPQGYRPPDPADPLDAPGIDARDAGHVAAQTGARAAPARPRTQKGPTREARPQPAPAPRRGAPYAP